MKDRWALLRSVIVWTTWQGSISVLSVPFIANFRATYAPDAMKEESAASDDGNATAADSKATEEV